MSSAVPTADTGPRLRDRGRDHPPAGTVRTRAKRPAPSPHPFWGLVFPLLVVAAAALVFAVWRQGTRLVLDSNAGERIETISDPGAPGWRAFVDPTPTMLVAHLSDGGELVGITVLAQTALDQGGTAVLIGAESLLQPAADPANDPADAVFAREVYETSGIEGLSRVVGDLFGFGFRETLEITTSSLGGWLRLVEPLPVVLSDDLVTVDGQGLVDTVYRAGLQQLSGTDAAVLYGWLNHGELDANRTQRQLELWEAWLARVGAADDLTAATLPFEAGLSPYLRSLGAGSRRLVPAALSSGGDDASVRARSDEQRAQLRSLAREMVPLPTGSHLGARPSVTMLDGTGRGTPRDELLPVLVDAGAAVTVIGNAAAFGVAETVVAYHSADDQQAAFDLAEAIGAAAILDEDLNRPSDLTVVVGLDRVGP